MKRSQNSRTAMCYENYEFGLVENRRLFNEWLEIARIIGFREGKLGSNSSSSHFFETLETDRRARTFRQFLIGAGLDAVVNARLGVIRSPPPPSDCSKQSKKKLEVACTDSEQL